MQSLIALGMISKTKKSHLSDLQQGFNDSGLQRYQKETPLQVVFYNQGKVLKNTYIEKYLQLVAS